MPKRVRSTTQAGPTSVSIGMPAMSEPGSWKCIGESRWVAMWLVLEMSCALTPSKAMRLTHLTVGPS